MFDIMQFFCCYLFHENTNYVLNAFKEFEINIGERIELSNDDRRSLRQIFEFRFSFDDNPKYQSFLKLLIDNLTHDFYNFENLYEAYKDKEYVLKIYGDEYRKHLNSKNYGNFIV